MSFFSSMNVSASGLTAQRLRMDVISENIANVNTTRARVNGETFEPYKRKIALFQEMKDTKLSFSSQFENALNKNSAASTGHGVRVSKIVDDETRGALVYEPSHPDANEDGYVEMPNVNVVKEMVNMISASRSYEANVTALNNTKSMLIKTLEISR